MLHLHECWHFTYRYLNAKIQIASFHKRQLFKEIIISYYYIISIIIILGQLFKKPKQKLFVWNTIRSKFWFYFHSQCTAKQSSYLISAYQCYSCQPRMSLFLYCYVEHFFYLYFLQYSGQYQAFGWKNNFPLTC